MVNPFYCNVFKKDSKCLQKLGEDALFTFICRNSPCKGPGPSCPYADEQPLWIPFTVAAIVAFLALIGFVGTCMYRQRRQSGQDVQKDIEMAGVGTQQQRQQWDLDDILWDHGQRRHREQQEQALEQLLAKARVGNARQILLNGSLAFYGYAPNSSASNVPAAAWSCSSKMGHCLGACVSRLPGAAACSSLKQLFQQLLKRPAVSGFLAFMKWGWFLVGFIMNILTLITLAQQTHQNKYRVKGIWLLYYAMVQGWLVWLVIFIYGTIIEGMTLLGKIPSTGLGTSVYIFCFHMFGFGMLSLITTPCSVSKVLATLINAVALLQTLLVPAKVFEYWVDCVCNCCGTYVIMYPIVPLQLVAFAEEPGLLERGYWRVSTNTRLPGAINDDSQGCCSWRTTVCHGNPDMQFMEVRTYKRKFVYPVEWVLTLPLRVYYIALVAACVVVGTWLTAQSIWYSFVTLAPAIFSSLLVLV